MKEIQEADVGRVFLLPGLGATSDLFAEYHFPFVTQAVEYTAPKSQEMGLSEYAQQLIAENNIRAGDSLIGVSLGGMLSCEIAKHISIRKLTLISSGTDSRHIQPFIRNLRPLSRVIPWRMIQKSPFPSIMLGQSMRRAIQMFRLANTRFIPWACSNAAVWRYIAPLPDLLQIHGDCDPVFPIKLQKVDHIIRGGDHLMILSHRQEIEPILIARHQSAS